eukprot:1820256-Prymnesium_polylepis.1
MCVHVRAAYVCACVGEHVHARRRPGGGHGGGPGGVIGGEGGVGGSGGDVGGAGGGDVVSIRLLVIEALATGSL